MLVRWRPQISLRWIAYLVLLAALGLGWYRDRQQAEEQWKRLPGEIAVLDSQLVNLNDRLTDSIFGRGLPPLREDRWSLISPSMVQYAPNTVQWTVEDFLAKVDAAASHSIAPTPGVPPPSFADLVFQIFNASDERFNAVLVPLLRYAEHSDLTIRITTLNLIERLAAHTPERIEPFLPEIVSLLIQRLEDPDSTIRQIAIDALTALGPNADAALEPLQKIMADKSDEWRVRATFAVAAIDPNKVSETHLKELVSEFNYEWENAALRLIETAPADDVDAFFREVFVTTAGGNEPYVARLLNELALKRMREGKEATDHAK